MFRKNEIEVAGNLFRQIEFWLGECRDTQYGDSTYSKECFAKAKKAAEALSRVGEHGE